MNSAHNHINSLRKNNYDNNLYEIETSIAAGHRIMIIMRGAPGSGKTFLAKSLLERQNFKESHNTFIFSTDDLFLDSRGVYRYNNRLISDCHDENQKRVKEKTEAGLSPIFIDNTNMQVWEIMPYVKYGVANGYIIKILEPKTMWRNNAEALANRNTHGVPKNKIKLMLSNYQPITSEQLVMSLKNTKYTMPLPQYRSIPPLNGFIEPYMDQSSKANANNLESYNLNTTTSADNNTDLSSEVWEPYTNANEPKKQRERKKTSEDTFKMPYAWGTYNPDGTHMDAAPMDVSYDTLPNNEVAKSVKENEQSFLPKRNVYKLLEEKMSSSSFDAWKPFEEESANFWGANQIHDELPSSSNDIAKRTSGEVSLLDLLRDDRAGACSGIQQSPKIDIKESTYKSLERHSADCPNENTEFQTLRQIYPQKRISGLWDLFVKCDGNVEWVVDILLRENTEDDEIDNNFTHTDSNFKCNCNSESLEGYGLAHLVSDQYKDTFIVSEVTQRQRLRLGRNNQHMIDPAAEQLKNHIENCFVLGDENYTENLLKVRNTRFPSSTTKSCHTIEPSAVIDNVNNNDNQEDVVDISKGIEEEEEETLELSLGQDLVQQLADHFPNETTPVMPLPDNLPPSIKIFMPRSIAKQLYMLWIESVYNYIEEERQELVREDEDFARLLKNPKYADCKESPSNVQELLDKEYATYLFKQQREEIMIKEKMEKQHESLAAHLTHMKLCEIFPDIPRETLLDMLAANDNNYSKTVSILESTMSKNNSQNEQNTEDKSKVNQPQQSVRPPDKSWDWDYDDCKKNISTEESKRQALRDFENTRNMAAHHTQLRGECFQKAKEAIQSGNGSAAIYYAQISRMHRQKIDMYNNLAANCIMEVHKYTQNNPDLLDLHYLHLSEALACLDLFLDRQIAGLRALSRSYKYVYVITGRGKHSAGGVSTIKAEVNKRLRKRGLRWSYINAGLLKAKLFPSSRQSTVIN